uniref:Uncharacterized protein n=1 Tax=Arundo donax TaxID=35708 RepID=A0A0A9DP50_ARUDO
MAASISKMFILCPLNFLSDHILIDIPDINQFMHLSNTQIPSNLLCNLIYNAGANFSHLKYTHVHNIKYKQDAISNSLQG